MCTRHIGIKVGKIEYLRINSTNWHILCSDIQVSVYIVITLWWYSAFRRGQAFLSALLCNWAFEIVFQEQSYSSLQSGWNLALDHFRCVIADPCGDWQSRGADVAIAVGPGADALLKLSSRNRVTPVSIRSLAWDHFRCDITDPCGIVAIPEAFGGRRYGDANRYHTLIIVKCC